MTLPDGPLGILVTLLQDYDLGLDEERIQLFENDLNHEFAVLEPKKLSRQRR